MHDHAIIMTTLPNKEEAQKLARGLVAEQLAACVQLLDIQSVYTWQGEVQEDNEVLLFIKTRSDLYDAVEVYLQTHHPYEVPEIVQVPITAGLSAYLAWMDEVTGK